MTLSLIEVLLVSSVQPTKTNQSQKCPVSSPHCTKEVGSLEQCPTHQSDQSSSILAKMTYNCFFTNYSCIFELVFPTYKSV